MAQSIGINTAEWILKLISAEPVDVDIIVLQTRASNESTKKSVPVHRLSFKNFKMADIMANENQITGVLYSLRQVLLEQYRRATFFIDHTEVHYLKVVITVRFCSISEVDIKSICAIIVAVWF